MAVHTTLSGLAARVAVLEAAAERDRLYAEELNATIIDEPGITRVAIPNPDDDKAMAALNQIGSHTTDHRSHGFLRAILTALRDGTWQDER